MNVNDRLKGKSIVITGASDGLGRQLAIDFALQGAARLALVARRVGRLNELRDYIKELAPGCEVTTIQADVSFPITLEGVAARVLDVFEGKVDVLVNNASTLGPSPMPLLVDYPVNEFQRVIATNLVAPFVLIQKLLPGLMGAGGSIINVTSDAGIHGYPGWGAYGISKFGLEGLSQTWSAELDDSGVRVNWVDPGSMNTNMHRLAEPDEDPLQWANPADCTDVFVFLASDESREVNGERFLAQHETGVAIAS